MPETPQTCGILVLMRLDFLSPRPQGGCSGKGVVSALFVLRLFCEQRIQAVERLELQGVAGRIHEEQSGLFTRLAFETDVGLDDELGIGGL